VFVAGLPGAGKSLLVQQAALLAADLGRSVHLLQWDVARLAFDTPEILARYPETDGVTHAAIRIAAGRWARGAVLRWHRAHPEPEHLLIGETPLAGERLMELARTRDDALEPLLASDATLFLIPVPSREVRRAIESARGREMSAPVHERDAASAPPHLVQSHWDELEAVADALGIARTALPGTYDPELYARVYLELLRDRRALVVPIARVIPLEGTVHDVPPGAREIAPSAAEVETAIATQMARSDDEIERDAAEWFRL
jgi:hypothetical protein